MGISSPTENCDSTSACWHRFFLVVLRESEIDGSVCHFVLTTFLWSMDLLTSVVGTT